MKSKAQDSPPSLKDIASEAGVSVMTASNVLRSASKSGRRLFSAETEKKVVQTAQRLGYVPNRAARSMRTRKTGIIGFVSANFSKETNTVENYSVHPFLVGMNHVLAPTERHVTLVELDELELQKGILPRALQERFFDALIVHYGLTARTLKTLEKFQVPVIYWDSGIFRKENCIYRDEFAVGRAVTEYLINLRHKRIGFHVGSGSNWDRYQNKRLKKLVHYSFAQRYEGYSCVLRERGLPETLLRGYETEGLSGQIKKARITAVITASVVSFYRAMAWQGKKIPGDLSLLTCDVESSFLNREEIGGALYNRYEAGKEAARMIISRLESQGAPVNSIVLPVNVSAGSTTGEL